MDTDIHSPDPAPLSPDDLLNGEVGEIKEENGSTSTYVKVKSAVYKVVGMTTAGAALICSPVSAATGTLEINWTPIADLIEGAAGIMPSVGMLLIASVSIIMIMLVVGFVTGIFGSILDAVKNIGKF